MSDGDDGVVEDGKPLEPEDFVTELLSRISADIACMGEHWLDAHVNPLTSDEAQEELAMICRHSVNLYTGAKLLCEQIMTHFLSQDSNAVLLKEAVEHQYGMEAEIVAVGDNGALLTLHEPNAEDVEVWLRDQQS
jgi:hypothetical protein